MMFLKAERGFRNAGAFLASEIGFEFAPLSTFQIGFPLGLNFLLMSLTCVAYRAEQERKVEILLLLLVPDEYEHA